MQEKVNHYKKFFPYSFLLHLVILVLLFGSVTFTANSAFSSAEKTEQEPVQAMVVDAQQVEAQIKSIQKAEARAKQKKLNDAWRLHVQAKKLKKEIAAQENKLATIKTTLAAEKEAVIKQKEQAQQKQAQAEKEAVLQASLQEKEKEARAKKLLEAQKAIDQQKREQATLAANEKAKRLASELEEYKTLVINSIEKKWLVPSSASSDMQAQLLIELGSDGTVKNVEVLKSSHNLALDSSAKAAVYSASPLPVPKDKVVLDQFRRFSLTVTPKDVA